MLPDVPVPVPDTRTSPIPKTIGTTSTTICYMLRPLHASMIHGRIPQNAHHAQTTRVQRPPGYNMGYCAISYPPPVREPLQGIRGICPLRHVGDLSRHARAFWYCSAILPIAYSVPLPTWHDGHSRVCFGYAIPVTDCEIMHNQGTKKDYCNMQ